MNQTIIPLTDILDKVKDNFIAGLAQQCGLFVTIGTPLESPRWFQYNGNENTYAPGEDGLLTHLYIAHSQTSALWFTVSVEHLTEMERQRIDVALFQEIYDYFKKVKYAYLAEKWPTIEIPSEYRTHTIPHPYVGDKPDNKAGIPKRKSHAFGKDVYLLGTDKEGIRYWLEAPTWDCGWYWGFGYVETYHNNAMPTRAKDIDSHTHIDSAFIGKHEYYDTTTKTRKLSEYIHNIYDNPTLCSKTFNEKEGWELSELFNQFYFLRQAAENFGRGKCHTANTTAPSWEKKDLAKEINEVHIPAVTARILQILSPAQ